MTIRQARTRAILDKVESGSVRAGELISAFFYISNSADIRRMADVLEVEKEAQSLARLERSRSGLETKGGNQ